MIKVGIVGCAGRGEHFFLPFKVSPLAEVTALCDINREGLERTGALVGVSELYTDYSEMIERAGLDAVVIGTPMPYHAEQSILALEAGIHVLCEVPAAVSVEECQRLVQAAKASKATYMMAENYCYFRQNILVWEIVKAGLFGQTYFGEGEYVHELKGLNEITTWRRKWQTGINGCTYPTHSLGPVYQWMNERITQVMCFGSGHHYKDPRGAHYENEDSTFMICRTDKGGLVNVRLDMLSNRPHCCDYYSLQGTDGAYEAARGPEDKNKIWLTSRCDGFQWMNLEDLQEEFLPDKWRKMPEEILATGHAGSEYVLVNDFLEAVVSGTKQAIDIYESLDMTLPGLVSQESIQMGSVWLDVPDPRGW